MASATPSKAPNRRSRSRRPPAEIDARRLPRTSRSHRPWHARPPGWRRPCRAWRGEEAAAARGRPAQEHGRVPSSFRGRQEPSEGATRAVAGVGSRYRRRLAGAPCSGGPSVDPEFRQGLVASVRNAAARSDRPSPGTGSSTATTRNGHDWTRFPAIVEAALRNCVPPMAIRSGRRSASSSAPCAAKIALAGTATRSSAATLWRCGPTTYPPRTDRRLGGQGNVKSWPGER
ncbi:hypothetical protein CI41S_11990 [Bradyrhizobium ivorense]|nr:hypothetical protein CI41S_11990 [Bradyrhizobium ivorense]